MNKQELTPIDHTLSESYLSLEAKRLTENWEKRRQSQKRIDKFFSSPIGVFILKLSLTGIATLINFSYIYVAIYFNPIVWIQIIIYVGLGLPVFGITFLILFITFDFLFIPPKKWQKKLKKGVDKQNRKIG